MVKRAIPNELACDALVELIKENGRSAQAPKRIACRSLRLVVLCFCGRSCFFRVKKFVPSVTFFMEGCVLSSVCAQSRKPHRHLRWQDKDEEPTEGQGEEAPAVVA